MGSNRVVIVWCVVALVIDVMSNISIWATDVADIVDTEEEVEGALTT